MESKVQNKENVLVWLDFDAYSYINFGVIIELAKLDKFDFIGIVTTKQDMSFFQKQKMIPFKKLIYYPDCYINESTFDLAPHFQPDSILCPARSVAVGYA